MGFKRSKADPCLFYRWTSNGVVLWMVVVDDCCGIGRETELLASKRQLMDIFACEGQGHMKEYIGNKIVYDADDKDYATAAGTCRRDLFGVRWEKTPCCNILSCSGAMASSHSR
jgi:hypothetical protein